MREYNQSPVVATPSRNPMVDFVVSEFTRYESFHRERFDNFQKIYDHWMNKAPRRDWEWQNAIHVPVMIEGEQTITPRIFAALFPEEAPIEVRVFGSALPEQGIIIKNAIKHDFRRGDTQGKSLTALTQNTLFGTSYLEATWLTERKWITNPLTQKRDYKIISQRNDVSFVSVFEMFPHPNKLSMTDGLPLIRRRFCDAEYIKGMSENPFYKFENLQAALDSETVVKQASSLVGPDGRALDLKKREEYEILEYWGPWDVTYEQNGKSLKQKAVPHWMIVINRSVLVRGIPNPYNHQRPPYVKTIMFTDAKPCWFGVGIGMIGKPTQERLNKIVNQRLDNVDLVLNKQGFFNGNDPLINIRKLQISQPGQWHKVSDTVASIRWMETPDVTQSSYKEEEIAKQDFRESTGATQVLMPSDDPQHRTATGISMLQGAAGERFRPVLRRLEIDLIQDLSQMFLSNMQQFMTIPEWMMMTSDSGEEQPFLLTPDQIQAQAMFIPTGISETLNKEVQIGQLLRFKELSVNDPTVNRTEINKRIAELLGFKNISKLLTPPQPTVVKPGGLGLPEQQMIQQRLAEGATPEQIRTELLGVPPAPEEEAGIMG